MEREWKQGQIPEDLRWQIIEGLLMDDPNQCATCLGKRRWHRRWLRGPNWYNVWRCTDDWHDEKPWVRKPNERTTV